MKDLIIDYMRLMRIPGAVGLALTPVAGALCMQSYSLSVLLPLFFIGVISKIYGFVMNDYFDVEIDKLSKELQQRALVKGTISKRNAMYIVFTCSIVGYLAIFVFFFQHQTAFYIGLVCIVIADIFTIIYNIYGKRLIGSDFFIGLTESLFFLFGAMMVITNEPPGIIVWIVFILIFSEQVYMNAVAGGLKDADHDYLRNVKNIALTSGITVAKDKKMFIPLGFKAFGLGERLFSSFLVFTPFVFFGIGYELWQIGLLVLFSILLLRGSIRMMSIKQFDRKNIRKLIASQLFSWHFLIPIILISVIDLQYVLILMFLPWIAYIFFSMLMGQKLLQPQI